MSQRNKFELNVEVTNGSEVDVEVIGIKGANDSLSKYYISCWEGGYGVKLIAKKEPEFDGASGTTNFDNLHLTKYDHGFYLCLDYDGDPKKKNKNFYCPVSTTVESGTEQGNFEASDAVTISNISIKGKTLRFNYRAPEDNSLKSPQYIVLVPGKMNIHFHRKTSEIIEKIKLEKLNDRLSVVLSQRLNPGDYILAYVMGVEKDNGVPNLKMLAGWSSFNIPR